MKTTRALLCALLVATTAPLAAATVAERDALLLDAFLATVAQAPELGLAQEALRDGIVTPLSKTIARADGVTLSVVADSLRLATEPAVRSQFATFADRFLATALLQLPRREQQSPDAPGQVEYRLAGRDGVSFLLSWRSDQPFASASVAASADACSRLLPVFDAGSVPAAAPAGLVRRQVFARSHAGRRYQRSTSWQLRQSGTQLRWVVSSDSCTSQG